MITKPLFHDAYANIRFKARIRSVFRHSISALFIIFASLTVGCGGGSSGGEDDPAFCDRKPWSCEAQT